jgi:PKD repeat protein
MTYRVVNRGREKIISEIKKYVIILTLVFITVFMFSGTITAANPLVANFTANTTHGNAPMSVQFNDTSTGNPDSWKWDFGDGKTSTIKNPIHNYTKTGNFHVSLNVTNLDENSKLTILNYITVNNSPLSNYNNISIQTANNGTYYMQNLGSGGGLNAVHIAVNTTSGPNYGQYTTTSKQSGILYVTDTGGRGYQDDIILMIAVNGTIPDNFALKIKSSGYIWTPNGFNTAPSLENITYQQLAINQTFYKNDFIYGLQNWKPAGGNTAYPIFLNEDMNDPSNLFNILFIDLHAGPLGSNYPGGNDALTDYGAVKINYIFENLQSIAAFNIYAWNANTTHGAGMGWTNSILPGQTGGPSGYTVIGSKKPTASFTTNVTDGIVPLNVQFTDKSTQTPISWAWNFGDGTTSTEQNPTHIYQQAGNYTITLTVSNAYANDETTGNITVKPLEVISDIPDGSYNTTQTINLSAPDNLYSNPQIYYTLNGTEPTTDSLLYNGAIILSSEGTTTLKFFAVDDGGNISDIVTRIYIIDKTAPTSHANPLGNTYNTKESVTISTTDNIDSNPTTYYTTDGTDPRNSTTRIKYIGQISINTTTKLRFATVDSAGNWSPVYLETYTMIYTKAPIPSVTLPSGKYTTDQVVKLSAVDELDPNPKIYYTLNGSNPTIKSTLYDWPISINIIGTTILKFFAVDKAGLISSIITRTYTLDKQGVGGTWNSTIIDTNGMYNSITIDKSGYPHIAYYQTGNSETDNPKLKYTYKDKTGWHKEIVDSVAAGAGFYVSLALDSLNYPHLVYGEVFGPDSTDKLKYAYKDANGWHIIILTENSYISYINMVLYKDQPRISFYNDSANNGLGELQYMYKSSTNWVIENVTPKSSGGRWNSLAIDSTGNPRISYYDIYSGPVQGSLRYAERTSEGVWKTAIVDGNMIDKLNVGMWNSIALDTLGNPHISYNVNSGGGGSLKYAYWNGTQWITETVSSLKSSCSKLVLNKANSPIIVYQDITTGNFEYAYQEGSKWIINNIDTVEGVGQWISLTLNSSGIPNVSYATSHSRLKYAYLLPFSISANPLGGTFNTTKSVVLKSTVGTTLYYTKDGSDPRKSGTRVKYTGPILIKSTTTLKFAAVDSAINWSSISTSTYIIDLPPTANASIKGGIYNTTRTVKLSMNEPGSIYYTTDGHTPTSTSKKYTGPINITSNTILRFFAVDATGNKSIVYYEKYTIDKIPPKVLLTYPKYLSRGFSRKNPISIQLSENIKTGVNWSKIYIKNLSTGKSQPITKSIKGGVIVINTTKSRNSYTWYQVYIPSSAIKDLAGNNLSKAYTLKFKTGRF